MNQQAIDILDEIMIEANNISIEQGCSEIDYDYRQLLQKAKSRIQALGDGWIPVTERLPEEKGVYLVYDGDDVYSCNFDDNNKFVIYNDGYEYFQNVTHWQPIPTPPKMSVTNFNPPNK